MKFSIERCLLFCILFFCLLLSRQSFGQIYINSPTVYPSSTTISQNLIVNDTLWVQGDLTLANKVVLTINQGGVVIIQENLITANKITLDIDSYLFILGSLTHTGAEKHAEAVVSDASHVYIFGDVSADFDNTDIACPDVDYEQGTINNCGHGTLDDFLEGESDNPIFEQIVSDKVEPTNNLVSFPEDGQLCPSGNVTLSIQEPEANNIFWYQDGVKVESAGALTKDVYSVGIYHAIYKLGTQWYQTNEIVIINDRASPSVSCPPDSTTTCIEAISAPVNTIAQFIARGGTVSDNCPNNGTLTIVWAEDVTDKKDENNPCQVLRTYIIADETGNSTNCTRTFTISDATAPEILDCPDDITDSADENCAKIISVSAPTNFTDGCGFGDVTVYHTYAIAGNTVKTDGEIAAVAFPKGTTIITWSFEDECGNIGTCEQTITIEDKAAPTASCPGSQQLDVGNACSVLLPDYTNLLTDLSDNCDSHPTVTQRPAVDTEVFVDTEVWLIYADEDGNRDSCSFMVNLINLAPLDISEMLYDGNQSGAGAIGSGQKPFITSTHQYEIDREESNSGYYTYIWLVLDQAGTEVSAPMSHPESDPRKVAIAFSETPFVEGSSYTVRVIKEQNTGNCSAVFELDIEIQESNFNSGVIPLGPTCQDGGTGVPTVVFWDVKFEGGVEPYAFDFSISDGVNGCAGQVSNLFAADSESIGSMQNCDATYTVAVTKEPGVTAVQIAFTFISEAGVDKDFNLTIQSATDQFSITKQTINKDDKDEVTLWGVPPTTDIQTN
ncbi:hypothetical protein [Sunxiuqinia rutila]|uniref:hypothetical protein n=1 Tax=Sunxiuqinia rutila TaxID=1397841 RepID=UPI003D35C85E